MSMNVMNIMLISKNVSKMECDRKVKYPYSERYSYSNVIKFKHKQSHLFIFLVNCKWGEWSIGSCHPTGNEGLRIKTRTKTVVEELGGTCKGTPTELEICNPGKHFLFDLLGRGRG